MRLARVQTDGSITRVTVEKKKARRLGFVCIIIALGFMAYALLANDFIVWRVLMALLAPIVAVIGISAWRQGAAQAKIVMWEITDDGLRHAKAGLISWDEIEDVQIYSMMGQRAVGIWTRDPDLVAKRVGTWWIRPLAQFNRIFGYAPITFTDKLIPVDRTLAVIQRHRTPARTENAGSGADEET